MCELAGDGGSAGEAKAVLPDAATRAALVQRHGGHARRETRADHHRRRGHARRTGTAPERGRGATTQR